jgi:uncharacterized protein
MLSASAGVYGHEIEPDGLVVARLDVHITGWPHDLAGFRVGHLSDTHCDSDRAVARAHRAAMLLKAQTPDVVFLTGDYITTDPHRWSAAAANALAPLASNGCRVFAVMGNHDGWAGDPAHVQECLENRGFSVLLNQSAALDSARRVWVVGLDYRCDDRQNPSRALRGVPADAIKLLLIHEPDYADECPPGFSLQFSGHSHGGQVRIPGLPPLLAPTYGRTYSEGLQAAKFHRVYTTRGVGVVGPKFRLFCPPEVALIRLFPKPVT